MQTWIIIELLIITYLNIEMVSWSLRPSMFISQYFWNELHHSLLLLLSRRKPLFNGNHSREIWPTAPSEIQLKKTDSENLARSEEERGQIGGRDSLGDCDNICEGNLVFRVIFGKFMHRWFQICAQLGSYNVFFSHHRPPKLKYCFFRGSFSQPTFKSKWFGEPD